jgi:pyrroloquinoline quinone biosynthesis protein B
MRVRLLGTAAGGGFPQWNCGCPNCRAVRAGEPRASARTQACVAIGADEERWFLVGASPDIRAQIESFPPLHPRGGVRGSPIEGILLTGADLDHVLGLFALREGGALHIHATATVRRALCEGLGLEAVLRHYCQVEWHEPPDRPAPLLLRDGQPSGLLFEAFPAPGKPPRYREGTVVPSPGDCIGYLIGDPTTGGRLAVLPSAALLDGDVLRRLHECDALLIDGTFWSEDELAGLGASDTPASAMGHLPVGTAGGSLDLIARLPARRKIYLHVNNTNRMLLDDSPERRQVEARGVEVGRDGLEFVL